MASKIEQTRLHPQANQNTRETSAAQSEKTKKAEVTAIEPWQQLFGAVVRVHQDLAPLLPRLLPQKRSPEILDPQKPSCSLFLRETQMCDGWLGVLPSSFPRPSSGSSQNRRAHRDAIRGCHSAREVSTCNSSQDGGLEISARQQTWGLNPPAFG